MGSAGKGLGGKWIDFLNNLETKIMRSSVIETYNTVFCCSMIRVWLLLFAAATNN